MPKSCQCCCKSCGDWWRSIKVIVESLFNVTSGKQTLRSNLQSDVIQMTSPLWLGSRFISTCVILTCFKLTAQILTPTVIWWRSCVECVYECVCVCVMYSVCGRTCAVEGKQSSQSTASSVFSSYMKQRKLNCSCSLLSEHTNKWFVDSGWKKGYWICSVHEQLQFVEQQTHYYHSMQMRKLMLTAEQGDQISSNFFA